MQSNNQATGGKATAARKHRIGKFEPQNKPYMF